MVLSNVNKVTVANLTTCKLNGKGKHDLIQEVEMVVGLWLKT